jgi:hypothetical protein
VNLSHDEIDTNSFERSQSGGNLSAPPISLSFFGISNERPLEFHLLYVNSKSMQVRKYENEIQSKKSLVGSVGAALVSPISKVSPDIKNTDLHLVGELARIGSGVEYFGGVPASNFEV